MWKVLKSLVSKLACRHQWVLEKTVASTWQGDIIGYEYIYICKCCGKIKIIKI